MLTRREFLQTAAAIPIAAAVERKPAAVRVAVIGAGAFGSWTAMQLRARGADVTLIDAWGPGNARSSSGGETRVIRAIYGADRVYSEMVKRAFEFWEALHETEAEIYLETGALWLHRGDDAYVRSAVPILHDLGLPVDKLSLEDAARRYPQIDFRGVRSVWLEHRAGVLLARQSCAAARDVVVKNGGTYRTAHVQPGAIANETMSALRLGDGSRVEADVYVFACGPWLGQLFPDAIAIQPTRQEVFFFGTPRGSERYMPKRLPIWIDFGERIVYGIPDTHGRGFKIADDTRGAPIDPSSADRTPSAEGIARARRVLAERFPELADAPLVESRVCQYENSPDGHLIIDRHPGAKNVWLVGGGSGHGFKLAPAVGEMTAAAVLQGKELPKLFRLGGRRPVARSVD